MKQSVSALVAVTLLAAVGISPQSWALSCTGPLLPANDPDFIAAAVAWIHERLHGKTPEVPEYFCNICYSMSIVTGSEKTGPSSVAHWPPSRAKYFLGAGLRYLRRRVYRPGVLKMLLVLSRRMTPHS